MDKQKDERTYMVDKQHKNTMPWIHGHLRVAKA